VTDIRRARLTDAAAIGAVHVAAWRSAYPGILPDEVLTRLSPNRQAGYYDSMIRAGVGIHVACIDSRVVGFVSGSVASRKPGLMTPGEGEIETLYVLDDWRERGIGRGLMGAAAAHLAAAGCASLFLWVLRDNPSRWFYERLGGKPTADSTTRVGGSPVIQRAYVWSPIGKLAQSPRPLPQPPPHAA